MCTDCAAYVSFIVASVWKPSCGIALSMHAVPDTVMNLTITFTDDELLILWTDLNVVVSHYLVTVFQGSDAPFQFNTSQLQLTVSREALGEHETTEIYVSAVNAAGIGQPAVVIYEQSNQSGISHQH